MFTDMSMCDDWLNEQIELSVLNTLSNQQGTICVPSVEEEDFWQFDRDFDVTEYRSFIPIKIPSEGE